jgi:hypothetical protein
VPFFGGKGDRRVGKNRWRGGIWSVIGSLPRLMR